MRSIPCSIDTIHTPQVDCWIISVPTNAVGNATADFSDLLADKRKKIVFSDRKTDFIVTSDSAAYDGRRISVTKDWLECLERLFSDPHSCHIDYDFSDKHGDVSITVRIT